MLRHLRAWPVLAVSVLLLQLARGWMLTHGGSPQWVAGLALLLALPAALFSLPQLGLDRGRWAGRLIGAVALAAVLLLPAAVRWDHVTQAAGLAPLVILVAAAEEIGFRGALFAALHSRFGGAVAVVGSTAAFTAGHALSHPPQFLPSVMAFGLLLACWRAAFSDLTAPIAGHALADLAL